MTESVLKLECFEMMPKLLKNNAETLLACL